MSNFATKGISRHSQPIDALLGSTRMKDLRSLSESLIGPFQAQRVDNKEQTVLRKKVRRWQVLKLFAV